MQTHHKLSGHSVTAKGYNTAFSTLPYIAQMLLMLALACIAHLARADEQSAKTSFYNNLAEDQKKSFPKESEVKFQPTLIKGLYIIRTHDGNKLQGFTNEKGTLYSGKSQDILYFPQNRKLNPSELNELKLEAMGNIDWSRLPVVKYGDGGTRGIIMMSAVDCPYCQLMERNLVKQKVNVTLLVVPSSLTEPDSENSNWATVSKLLCANDKESAWHNFWQKGNRDPKAVANCPMNTPQAFQEIRNLGILFILLGLEYRGTPAFFDENGINMLYDHDYLNKTFVGEPATPTVATSSKWIFSSAAAPNAQQKSKVRINIGNIFKKILAHPDVQQ